MEQLAAAAAAYIEEHLEEPLNLETVAQAVHYSKYYLHRCFTAALGLTPHDYIQRRRLTEAARRLALSRTPILEAALAAGYESQQAFSDAFKAMYKQTPLEFRRRGSFYPLQLPSTPGPLRTGPRKLAWAVPEDLPAWMDFTALVIGGFPCLEEAFHREEGERYIRQRRALVLREGGLLIGAAAFTPETGSIDFLAAHPRRQEAAGALLALLTGELLPGRELTVTTFRQGDRADLGQRREYLRLGFEEGELLTQFGYPVQQLHLSPGGRRSHD